jgi:hypothetical protein
VDLSGVQLAQVAAVFGALTLLIGAVLLVAIAAQTASLPNQRLIPLHQRVVVTVYNACAAIRRPELAAIVDDMPSRAPPPPHRQRDHLATVRACPA